MLPYLHLGPFFLPTYGLMVAIALMTAAAILQADFDRRGIRADAYLMVTFAGLAGILGSKVYYALEDPSLFFADPIHLLFNRYGFTWFGGFLGGFGVMLWMGWRAKLPLLSFLDACSPAASFGYAIGRIGCLLSGDGDYGRPTSLPWGMSFPKGVVPTTERVHPAPLYEFLIWCALGVYLWRLGAKAQNQPRAKGEVFAAYLLLTGVARFLVEIIRINPPVLWGLSNAQVVSLLSVLAGVLMLALLKKPQRSRQ